VYAASVRPTLLVILSLVCLACTDPTVVSDDGANTTTTNGDGDGDATSTSGDGDGDGDGEPSDDACGCEDGQLCVGDCVWGPFEPHYLANARCVDGAPCEQGVESSACMELACGAASATTLATCESLDVSNGYDIICDPASSQQGCDPSSADCPEGEKCVPQLPQWGPDAWGTARCVPVVGTHAPGEACSSTGADPAVAGTDSCDAGSVCWSGSLSGEPFEGLCQPYCSQDLACPEQQSCEPVVWDIPLCVPSP
jgi:hypothetical protein